MRTKAIENEIDQIIKKKGYIDHRTLLKLELKDPKFKKVYDSLQLEFQIIDVLIKTRIDKKLTQRAFAKRIGIAQSALARFESGRSNPTLSLLSKIVSGLGLRLQIVV